MAAKKGSSVGDQFANIAYLEITQAAANTIQFQKLEVVTGALMSVESKYGLILHRAEYFTEGVTSAFFNNEASRLEVALSVSQNIATLNLNQPEVLDKVVWKRLDQIDAVATLAAGSGSIKMFIEDPIVHDFDAYGGILVPADRLYVGVCGTGVGAAGQIHRIRLFYTTMQLSTEQYWELIEARRIIST